MSYFRRWDTTPKPTPRSLDISPEVIERYYRPGNRQDDLVQCSNKRCGALFFPPLTPVNQAHENLCWHCFRKWLSDFDGAPKAAGEHSLSEPCLGVDGLDVFVFDGTATFEDDQSSGTLKLNFKFGSRYFLPKCSKLGSHSVDSPRYQSLIKRIKDSYATNPKAAIAVFENGALVRYALLKHEAARLFAKSYSQLPNLSSNG